MGQYQLNKAETFCDKCKIGKYSRLEGFCQNCPKGYYQDGRGSTSCKACLADSYGTQIKAVTIGQCEKCLKDVQTTGNITGASVAAACKCQADGEGEKTDYFLDGSDDFCSLCPQGAVCPLLNAKVLDLYAQSGYWQSQRNTTKYWQCVSGVGSSAANAISTSRCCHPNGTSITGAVTTCKEAATTSTSWYPDMQCEHGYTGPLCLACSRGTHVQRMNYCEPCSGGSNYINVVFTMMGIFIVLFSVTFWLLWRLRRSKSNNKSSKFQKIAGHAKILIQWLQIVASLPQTLQGTRWLGNWGLVGVVAVAVAY